MPVASAIAEMSFSVLRRLKTYVRSTMKNDRLSSLGLMHINRDFEVDLYKAMEVFASTGTRIPDPLFPHLVPPAIMVWIFVWKYIFEPFIHILQHFGLQLSRSTNFCF